MYDSGNDANKDIMQNWSFELYSPKSVENSDVRILDQIRIAKQSPMLTIDELTELFERFIKSCGYNYKIHYIEENKQNG